MIEKHRTTSGTRSSGRTTIPGLFADMIFGPAKD